MVELVKRMLKLHMKNRTLTAGGQRLTGRSHKHGKDLQIGG
jgi:hypothetical protein